jgi:hypothetical protein
MAGTAPIFVLTALAAAAAAPAAQLAVIHAQAPAISPSAK